MERSSAKADGPKPIPKYIADIAVIKVFRDAVCSVQQINESASQALPARREKMLQLRRTRPPFSVLFGSASRVSGDPLAVNSEAVSRRQRGRAVCGAVGICYAMSFLFRCWGREVLRSL